MKIEGVVTAMISEYPFNYEDNQFVGDNLPEAKCTSLAEANCFVDLTFYRREIAA